MKRLILVLAVITCNFIYCQPKITYIDDEQIVSEYTPLFGVHVDLAPIYAGNLKFGVDYVLDNSSLITGGLNISGSFTLPYRDFEDFYGNTLSSPDSKLGLGFYSNYKRFFDEGIMDDGAYISFGVSLSRYNLENEDQINYQTSTLYYSNIFLGLGYQYSFGDFYFDQSIEIGFRKENFNGESVYNNNDPQFTNRNRNLIHLGLGFKIGYIMANKRGSNFF